jgi:hypothetical protein
MRRDAAVALAFSARRTHASYLVESGQGPFDETPAKGVTFAC